MTVTHCLRSSTALLTTVALMACGSANSQSTVASAPAPAGVAFQQGEAGAIARARADSVRRPYTEADVTFMTGMIGHHAQAIEMSLMAPTHGASPTVQTLAARIINAQEDEIGTMQRWLRDRLQTVPDGKSHSMKMMHGGMEHEMMMPGMLTDAQMKQLGESRGKEFDRLFLTYMIQHHRGALTMVNELFGSYGAGQDELVFKFASDVNVDQTTEIARMERMLFALALENYSSQPPGAP